MSHTTHPRPCRPQAAVATALLLTLLGGCTKAPRQVTASPEEIRQALQSGLAVAGSATPRTVNESLGLSSYTYLAWDLDLKLTNGSPFDLALGKDLLLVEANPEGAVFDGVAVLRGQPPSPGGASSWPDLVGKYGLSNCDVHFADGEWFRRRGSMTIFTTGTARRRGPGSSSDPETVGFGPLAKGAELPIKLTVEEGTWVKDELRASVRVVFPELEVTTARGPERFRLVAYFQRPVAPQTAWTANRTELIQVAREELARLLEVPETNLVTRVLAANWLAQADPTAAAEVLTRVAQPLQEGQLLATSLELLTELKRPEVADHALALLDTPEGPNGIRRLAALYLGTVKHEKAFASLVKAAKGEDDAVAGGAILGLGAWGDARAVGELLALLRDDSQ
jgi:hypothetical protein